MKMPISLGICRWRWNDEWGHPGDRYCHICQGPTDETLERDELPDDRPPSAGLYLVTTSENEESICLTLNQAF